MTVTVEQLARQVRAEESEYPQLELLITQSTAYLNNMINRDFKETKMNDNEIIIYDLAVMMLASSFYLNSGEDEVKVANGVTGLDSVIQQLRYPAWGGGLTK